MNLKWTCVGVFNTASFLEHLCSSELDIVMAIDFLKLKIIRLDFQLVELAQFQSCPFTPNGSLLIQGLIAP